MRTRILSFVLMMFAFALLGVPPGSSAPVAAQDQTRVSETVPAQFWAPHLARMKKGESAFINAELILSDQKGQLSLVPRWLEPSQSVDGYGLKFVRLTVLDPVEHQLSLDLEGFEGGFCRVDAAEGSLPLVLGNPGTGKKLDDSSPWRVTEIVDGKKLKTIPKERVRLRLFETTLGQKVWLSRRYLIPTAANRTAEVTGTLYNPTQVATVSGSDSFGPFVPLTRMEDVEDQPRVRMEVEGIADRSLPAFPDRKLANPNQKPSFQVLFAVPGTPEPSLMLPRRYVLPYLSDSAEGSEGWVYPNFFAMKKNGELFVADGPPWPYRVWDSQSDLPGVKVTLTNRERREATADFTGYPSGFGYLDSEGREFDPANFPKTTWIRVTKIVIGNEVVDRLPSSMVFERVTPGWPKIGQTVFVRPSRLKMVRSEEDGKFRFRFAQSPVNVSAFTSNQGNSVALTRVSETEFSADLRGVTHRWREETAEQKKSYAIREITYEATTPANSPPKKGR